MSILVLEASTVSAKAMLYEMQTGQYETATVRYPENWAADRQDAQAVYSMLCETARSLLAGRTAVQMIVLNTTWHSLLLCDQTVQPCSPVYLWSHLQAAEICRSLQKDEDWVRQFYEKTGCQVNASYPFFKLLWCRSQGKRLPALRIADLGSYLAHCLTGVYGITQSMVSGSGLMAQKTLDYDAQLLAQAGISRSQLPEIYPSDQTFPLSKEGAVQLNLPCGIPVMLANPDGGMNQVGAGALRERNMTLSVGTSGALRLSVSKPNTTHNHGLWCYRSPKGWLAGAATSGACNCIDWAKATLFVPGTDYREMEGRYPAQDRPLFLPFLFGERAPGWDATRRGGFLLMHGSHTAQDCYQAVQEGVLFNLYQCYERLCADYGEPQCIRLSGGILHSPRWTQMCADIFGRTMQVEQNTQSSLMGGAVLAMEKLGKIREAAQFTPPIREEIQPDAGRHADYLRQYGKYLTFYANT